MSAERTPAEVVKDLRGFIDWYGCDPGVPMSAVDVAAEAADLIERLDVENERLRAIKKTDDGAYEHVVEMYHAEREDNERLRELYDALPDCLRCTNVPAHQLHPNPCPDCVDGKVSPAQLAALWQAVHDVDYVHPAFLPAPNGVKEAWVAGAQSVYRHLRAVRPT